MFRLIIRLSIPKATALIFGSGKVVLTGLRAPEDAAPALVAVLELSRAPAPRFTSPCPPRRS